MTSGHTDAAHRCDNHAVHSVAPRFTRPGRLTLIALIFLAVAWAAAGGFVLLGRATSAAAQRVRDAPECAPDETFTATPCQATLSGTVISLTHDEVDVDVDGRRITMPIQIVGQVSGAAGTRADVTMYRGKPIHVEGTGEKVDARDSPVQDSFDYFNVAFAIVWISTVLIGANVVGMWIVVRSRRKASP